MLTLQVRTDLCVLLYISFTLADNGRAGSLESWPLTASSGYRATANSAGNMLCVSPAVWGMLMYRST